ncbi:MAG: immunoglobulin domain-containing protein, partial [Lachnospiraceae bacterium]|nr:immunoglobulin domain-containing protein [Lachnospiraceae bacterium]
NFEILEGNGCALVAIASGTGELSYQWYKDGNKLVGQTSYLLSITNAELSDSGEYYAVVTDKYDEVTSNTGVITVIPTELTLTHPKSADLTVGDSTTLSVSVAEKDEYTYQWYKNGEKISGATASKLELKDVELEDAGDYYVIVKGTYANATSNIAKVTVEEETTATTEEETTATTEEETTATTEEETTATTEEETTATTEEETTTATEEETTTSTEDETTAATTEKVDEEPVTGDVSTFGLVALLVLMALAGVTSFKLRNKI